MTDLLEAVDALTKPTRSKVIQEVAEKAWREGALWAAVECNAIADENSPWLAPDDNPYRKGASSD